jgi:hypothetical protein
MAEQVAYRPDPRHQAESPRTDQPNIIARGANTLRRLAMNPGEVLRIVDAIHRDNIDKETLRDEAALVSAARSITAKPISS